MTHRDTESRVARQLPKRHILKATRWIVGERGSVERAARSVRNAVKFKLSRPIRRRDMFAWRTGPGPRVGIYAMGGCDVRTVVGAGAALARQHTGTLAIGSFGHAPETRSDLLLQTLDPPRSHPSPSSPAIRTRKTARSQDR